MFPQPERKQAMRPIRGNGLSNVGARSREFSFDLDFKPFFCGGHSGRAFIDRNLQLVSPSWKVLVGDLQMEAAMAVIIGSLSTTGAPG